MRGRIAVGSPRTQNDLVAIVDRAIAAASGRTLVERAIATGRVPGFDLSRPTTLIAAGKAAAAMASAYLDRAGAACTGGVVVSAHGRTPLPDRVEWVTAGHPVPTLGSVRGGRRALQLAAETPADAQLLVLLSGGASALLAVPHASITLDDKQAATAALLRAGAAIHDLNCVRKHLSAIKGGRLAAVSAAPTFTLAISDVVGPVEDDPSVIGSGPTVPDPSTFSQALAAVTGLGVRDVLPPIVCQVLEQGARGEVEETPKPGDPRLASGGYVVIGSRHSAMQGAAREAERRGYQVHVLDAAVTGEAREVAPDLLARALAYRRERDGPCCIISSGETTVQVRGAGKGGRNQELVLALVEAVAAASRPVWLASVGTDGIDGPTDAAGAVVEPTTAVRAARLGLAPSHALESNDAYHFFERLNGLVRTGPTDTNVGDLQVALVF
jgi:glycerate 2-kinase